MLTLVLTLVYIINVIYIYVCIHTCANKIAEQSKMIVPFVAVNILSISVTGLSVLACLR